MYFAVPVVFNDFYVGLIYLWLSISALTFLVNAGSQGKKQKLGFILKMNRSQRGALAGDARLTAGASSSTGENDDSKERDDLQKKCKRKGVKWCKEYFRQYGIADPNEGAPESFDWPHFSDCVLQGKFNYHNKSIRELNAFCRYIEKECGSGIWPAAESDHILYAEIAKNLDPALSLTLRL